MNKLFSFFASFLKSKKRKIKDSIKLSEELANMIAFLNRKVFDNESVRVHVIPSDVKEWENEPGNALYCSSEDYYAVLVKNIHQLSITSPDGLFGTAAHEVRHRFQKKYPNSILSEKFLENLYILKANAIEVIKNEISEADFRFELDSMVIEELVRTECRGLSLEEIIEDKTEKIISIITCNEKTFHFYF